MHTSQPVDYRMFLKEITPHFQVMKPQQIKGMIENPQDVEVWPLEAL